MTMPGRQDGDDLTPAEVLGRLEGYRPVRTPHTRTGPDGNQYRVYLRFGDHVCSKCDDLIPPDSYGDAARLRAILGRLKLKYGRTYCADCLEDVNQ